jgi:hypothetical protein
MAIELRDAVSLGMRRVEDMLNGAVVAGVVAVCRLTCCSFAHRCQMRDIVWLGSFIRRGRGCRRPIVIWMADGEGAPTVHRCPGCHRNFKEEYAKWQHLEVKVLYGFMVSWCSL